LFSIRRFGARHNRDVLHMSDDEQPTTIGHRQGHSSTSLLNDIRQRKRQQTELAIHTNSCSIVETNIDDEPTSTAANDEGLTLIRDLKNYLLKRQQTTTNTIIKHFQQRLSSKPDLIPKFKSLLKEIAILQRTSSGLGIWILKDEFR
jgi:hypothetical protein